jgi:phage baseplate assembly protein gpV
MEKTVLQEISDLEKEITELKRTVRIGTVTTVDVEGRKARVAWANGIRSAPLNVIQNGSGWMPKVGDKAVSLHRPGDDGDGFILGVI